MDDCFLSPGRIGSPLHHNLSLDPYRASYTFAGSLFSVSLCQLEPKPLIEHFSSSRSLNLMLCRLRRSSEFGYCFKPNL